MEVIVVKRDGTEVPFDVERIANAIFKAAKSVGGANEITAHKLAYQVAEIIDSKSAHRHELPTTKVGENSYVSPLVLQIFNPTKWHVEDIQDIVEKVLIENGHARTAKEYILYRQRRTDVRNMSSALSKTIDSFVVSDAADDDEKRENANIDGDSTFGIMLKVGGTVMKDYVMRKCMKEKHALMHRRGEIHYHDMDLSRLCFNCLQIPLDKLLDKGYSTGHGYLRTPSNIQSASALSCIALQSNQNDMFGGQSIPSLDYYLAPYVAKSFIRNFAKYIEITYHIDPKELKSVLIKPIDKWIFNHENRVEARIMNNDGRAEIHDIIVNDLAKYHIDDDVFFDAWDYAEQQTDKDTFQAMESLVHNLCTMQSRAGNQTPFSSVNLGIDISPEGRLITKNLFLAQEKGLGNGETAIFPISIMKMKKGVTDKGSPNYDLFKLACRVSTKRLFPNFLNLDSSFNLPYYKTDDPDHHVATMGCAEGNEVVIWRVDEEDVRVTSFKLMYRTLKNMFPMFVEEFSKKSEYIDLEKRIVEIYDSFSDDFVKVKKVIRNSEVTNWRTVHFTNGRVLTVTGDHPLPVIDKGRTFVDNLIFGDKIPLVANYDFLNNEFIYDGQLSEMDNKANLELEIKRAWLMGMIICDGTITRYNTIVSVGHDEFELVEAIINYSKLVYNCNVTYKLQERGPKGNYYDVNIQCGNSRVSDLIREFNGILKRDREIPWYVFNSCREIRLSFLAGIVDADGYITDARDNTRVQIGSTNKALALQQAILAESLGYQAKIYENRYDSSDFTKVRYRVEFFVTEEFVEYIHCTKKLNKCGKFEGKPTNSEYCVFDGIYETPYDYNLTYSYDVETESDHFDLSMINSHNCRTRVIGNTYDPSKAITPGRGNLFFITVNLPFIALRAKRRIVNKETDNSLIDEFWKLLDEMMDEVFDCELDRFKMISTRKAKNYPFLLGQHLYVDSENLYPDDSVEEVIKHGTLTTGFIGLAETLVVLTGKHHGESEESQELGLKIISHMNDRCNAKAEETKLNFSLMGSPAEGCCGRLLRLTKKEFGEIKGVTDHAYLTNSHHVPVYYPISAKKKIDTEAPYHKYEPAGQISYVEISGDPSKNVEAFQSLVEYMAESDMGYFSINHPVSHDPICGYTGHFEDVCPRCGRKNGEGVEVGKLLSLMSYSPDPKYAVKASMIEEENETIPNSLEGFNHE